MKNTRRTRVSAAATLITIGIIASGCAAAGEPTDDGEVTITVGDMPTSEQPEERAAFDRTVEEFEAANPGITVEGDEATFDVSTFQALLAGGQLPTVFYVPFTEMQGLISRQQVRDISDVLDEDSLIRDLSPTVTAVVTGEGGEMYGVPTGAYTMGLLYNRDLFEAAGLDPDDPPTSWEEVREAAVQIEQSTDAQGFLAMTTDGTGGWILNTMTYAFGDRLESEDGTTATIDNESAREVLKYYRQLRWDDEAMGSNFLVNWGDVMNNFAAGSVGMVVQGADAYGQVVTNRGMSPDAFGLAPLPQMPDGLGTLGGGTVGVFSPTATDAEAAAAAKWVEYRYFNRYQDEDAAVSAAEAAAADGLAVGAPGLQLFDERTNETYLEWIKEYINVPRENYAAYLESGQSLPLVPEPPVKAQELYRVMDTVVQAVLTREDADIDALLADAEKQVQAVIDAG